MILMFCKMKILKYITRKKEKMRFRIINMLQKKKKRMKKVKQQERNQRKMTKEKNLEIKKAIIMMNTVIIMKKLRAIIEVKTVDPALILNII